MFGKSKKDGAFYDAFRDLAQLALEAAETVSGLLEDVGSAGRLAGVVKDKRRSADTILKNTVRLLHTTWITPFDRHQIHDLLINLDGVVALADSTASRVVVFGIREARGDSRALARDVNDCCKHVREVTNLLPKLEKEHAERVMALAGEIHEIEGKADEVHRGALAELFDGRADPLTVMKWREILDNLGQSTNLCRDVSKVFEAIVLENA